MEGGGGLGGKVWLLLGGDDDEVAVSSGSGCVGIKTKKNKEAMEIIIKIQIIKQKHFSIAVGFGIKGKGIHSFSNCTSWHLPGLDRLVG